MDNLNLTISLIGSICGLIMLGVLVWCMWLCTKFFGIKGFLRFVGVVILPVSGIVVLPVPGAGIFPFPGTGKLPGTGKR